MRRVSPVLALILLAALAIATACGDDNGPPLTAEQFVEQANAACVAGDAELEKAGKDLTTSGQPKTEEIAEFFLDSAVPIARRKLDQIEALNPPADKAEAVKEMLAAGREAVDEVEDGLKDDPGAYLTEKGPDPFDDFDERARELGLDKCASQAQPLPGEGDGSTTTTTPPATTPPDTTPPDTTTPPSS
ncbi:MAG: hypothetical protein ACRDYV_02105 [Acidimicrobiia bacterium]